MAEIFDFVCRKALPHVSSSISRVIEDLESAYEPDLVTNLSSGLAVADFFKTIFEPGQLIVLTGNSDKRNSLFIRVLAHQLAKGRVEGICGVLCRNPKKFAMTLLAIDSGISTKKLLAREWLEDDDWNLLTATLERLNNSEMFVGEISLNLDLLTSSVKHHVEHLQIKSDSGIRSQIFIDNLQPLLKTTDAEMDSPLTALSLVLTELKQLAVEKQLQVVAVHHSSDADWATEQSVIARHADAILTLTSRPDRLEFGQESNCTFSMSVNGEVVVEPTELRIDEPM